MAGGERRAARRERLLWYQPAMRPFVRRAGSAILGAPAGGLLATPPGLDGDPGLGIPGVTGVPQAQEWDAVESAEAPELRGDQVHFVALADGDGTVIVDEDEPDGSVAPLADAIEKLLEPPYRAVGVRQSDAIWSVGAVRVDIVELPAELAGDAIELASVDGERELKIDGEPSQLALPALDDVASRFEGDYALLAERLTETAWAVDAQAL